MDVYKVSNKGRVEYSNGARTFGTQGSPYKYYGQIFVHQLVAYAFHGPPPTPLHTVDHINFDPTDNCVENLQWCTQSKQIKRNFDCNRMPTSSGEHTRKPVQTTNIESGEIIIHRSVKDAALYVSRGSGSVSQCCSGVRKSVNGFSCKYYIEEVPVGWNPLVIDGAVTTFSINAEGLIRNRLGKVTRGSLKQCYYQFQIDGKNHRVHNLVALTFLPPKPTSRHTIDHINRNPGDNRVVNLRWATPEEQTANQRTAVRVVKQTKSVEYKREEENEWLVAESAAALVEILGAKRRYIQKCCQSEKSINGYNLRYLAESDIPGEIWKTVPIAEFQKFRDDYKAARAVHAEKVRIDRAERRAVRDASAAKRREQKITRKRKRDEN